MNYIINVIVIFCLIKVSTSNEEWHSYSHHFYYVSSTKITWPQAKDDCESKDGYLVTLDNEDEKIQVTKMAERDFYWSGLYRDCPQTDTKSECGWKWIQDNSYADTNTVDKIKGKCTNKNHVMINFERSGKLQCQPLENEYKYICETPDKCIESDNPCENNGTCSSPNRTHYICDCSKTGFTGKQCEEPINECDSYPCQHNGICQDGFLNYTCNCANTGYEGNNCQINIDECKSDPCQNNGKCHDGVNSYTCECEGTGFEGPHCNTEINECESNPCQHNGICQDGLRKYTCDCENTGFKGLNCEININECASDPCKNNGKCRDQIKSYICQCEGTGYEGSHCEKEIDECRSDPCQHNGICQDEFRDYTCECKNTGYRGKNCHVDINECLSNQHNCSLNSNCTNTIGSYTCTCAPNFSGRYCDVAGYVNNERWVDSTSPWLLNIFYVCLSFMLLTGLIALAMTIENRVYHYKKGRSRIERESEEPRLNEEAEGMLGNESNL